MICLGSLYPGYQRLKIFFFLLFFGSGTQGRVVGDAWLLFVHLLQIILLYLNSILYNFLLCLNYPVSKIF